jgi:hypothetical protein
MGCGCKNKSAQQLAAEKQRQVEAVQSTIKKTVSKYYTRPLSNQ